MRGASAFAPGHITGFFQICDMVEDSLFKGSRGAGFSITRGVRTRVKVEPAEKNAFSIFINGESTSEAQVSENVIKKMVSSLGEPQSVWVEHDVQIPVGAGFGSSGGGALSLALALNRALGLGMSRIEAARVAHIAEIECKTGLGTVLAELSGGFGVSILPGAPGIGETVKFSHSSLSAVCLSLGPIPTEEALADSELRVKINEVGGRFVDELHRDQRPETFMQLSRRFAEHVGLITPRLRVVLDGMDEMGFLCSMAMFGEVVFSLVPESKARNLEEALQTFAKGHELLIAGIDERGARLT